MKQNHESERSSEIQAECDLRTLIEAAKIRSDKSRSSAVSDMAKKQRAALDNLSKGEGNGK